MEPQRPEEGPAEKGFTVSDKRLFTREGQRKPQAEPAAASRASAPPPPKSEAPPPRDLPPADFSTFVTMLASNVMMFLGQVPDPVSQQRRLDLTQAKHTIDILLMLREKTQGNLSAEEQRLVQEVLPQLQMAYVSASRQ